jgi:Na+/melibiose symporter-like transporter
MFGSLFFLTQYLQFVLGYTPFQAGLRLIPMALVMMVSAPTSARMVERFGSKRVMAVGLGMVAVALLLLSRASPTSGYGLVITALIVMAAGMGFIMAPATDSIMGSLPRAKAGIGSAVNDTTRQTGGALGVAVLGSLLASSYRSSVAPVVDLVPAGARAAVRDSIGSAIAVSRQIGGEAGARLATTARAGFIHAMDVTLRVAAGVMIVGLVVVLAFLPARAREEEETVEAPSPELKPVSA